MSTCCIIVPCYNEAARIRTVAFLDYLRMNTTNHMMFVDDGSKDKTLEVLERMRMEIPDRIQVLVLENNSGKAEAVRRGMIEAAAMTNVDYIGFLDADLSAPLKVIAELISALDDDPDWNIAFGSRVKRLGTVIERKWTRHILGRVFATVATTLLGVVAYDSQCGMKLFRRNVVVQLFDQPFVSQWFFDLEIILRSEKGKIIEVPITEWREVGHSKIKWTDFLKAPFEILRIRRHYL